MSDKQQHFDPLDNLSEEELKEAYKKADRKLIEEMDHRAEINLATTETQVPNQTHVVISFVGKDCRQKAHFSNKESDSLGMKIYGAFPNKEDAARHAELLSKQEENKPFDIYVCEMYNWCLIPPNPDLITDQVYQEKKLNEIITGYKQSRHRAKEVFDMRKLKLMSNPDVNKTEKAKAVKDEVKPSMEPVEKLPAFSVKDVTASPSELMGDMEKGNPKE
jgi:hypothetical protein